MLKTIRSDWVARIDKTVDIRLKNFLIEECADIKN